MKLSERLELAKGDQHKISKELDNALKKAKTTRIEFERTRGLRQKQFMSFFNLVASEVDVIYKVCRHGNHHIKKIF